MIYHVAVTITNFSYTKFLSICLRPQFTAWLARLTAMACFASYSFIKVHILSSISADLIRYIDKASPFISLTSHLSARNIAHGCRLARTDHMIKLFLFCLFIFYTKFLLFSLLHSTFITLVRLLTATFTGAPTASICRLVC